MATVMALYSMRQAMKLKRATPTFLGVLSDDVDMPLAQWSSDLQRVYCRHCLSRCHLLARGLRQSTPSSHQVESSAVEFGATACCSFRSGGCVMVTNYSRFSCGCFELFHCLQVDCTALGLCQVVLHDRNVARPFVIAE
jgi:hypothetical protein